ncbi:MAG: phosphate uptake regulator PhoU [Methanomassiliicoccales archaeon]|nr:MAG: phosphate uptake regulator PhoU [Methanomassiliicoccales archaeon]
MILLKREAVNLEIRRVQKTGSSTMTVSLPKDWVDQQGIKPGDPVSMIVLPDGTISIDPKRERKKDSTKRTIWVESNEASEHLTRKLIGAYLAGFNLIEVRSKDRLDHEIKHAVKDFARLVIGPEVIEETSNFLLLHDLSDPVELPQEKCVRRMHLIVSSMHKDAMESLSPYDVDLAHDICDRDADVDRLYWMAVKQYNLIIMDRRLSEKIGVDVFQGMNLMTVARGIERIGDHAEKIAKNILAAEEQGIGIENVEDLRRASKAALGILDSGIGSFFLKDIKKANNAIDQGKQVVINCESLSASTGSRNTAAAVIQTSILDSIVRTTMYGMDIAEIAINAAMREPQ